MNLKGFPETQQSALIAPIPKQKPHQHQLMLNISLETATKIFRTMLQIFQRNCPGYWAQLIYFL